MSKFIDNAEKVKKINDSLGSSMVTDENPYIKYKSTVPNEAGDGYDTEYGFEHFVGGVGVKISVPHPDDIRESYEIFKTELNRDLADLDWCWDDLRKENLKTVISVLDRAKVYDKYSLYLPKRDNNDVQEKKVPSKNKSVVKPSGR